MTEPKKQTAKEFLRQRNFFEVVLERIVSGVCAADREGRIYYVNRGMTAISDIPKEDILAKRSLMELFIDRDAVLHSAYDRAKNTLQPIQYIAAPVVLSNRRLRYISGWFIPSITEETLDGMLLTAVDMTEREEAERGAAGTGGVDETGPRGNGRGALGMERTGTAAHLPRQLAAPARIR